MGDVSQPSKSPSEYPGLDVGGQYQGPGAVDGQPSYSQGQSPAHDQHYPAHFAQSFGTSQQPFSNQFDMAQPHGAGRQGPYNMNAMAGALPHGARPTYPQAGQQRFNQGNTSSAVMHHPMAQMQQYPTGAAMSHLAGQQYYIPQQPQMQTYYNTPLSPSQHSSNMPRPHMNYYPGQMVMNHAQYQSPVAVNQYYHQPSHFQGQPQVMSGHISAGQFLAPEVSHGGRLSSPSDEGERVPSEGRTNDSSDSRSNVVRGPPRKPRQSGHAIWIGNLPPQTDLMSLVHHVCKEAYGLESLFLISKSNCAFANFKDEPTCVAAQQKLHDSKFQSVRLVSRLRKSTVEGATGVTAPTGPAATATSPQQPITERILSPGPPESEKGSTMGAPEAVNSKPIVDGVHQKDKFFILKSLTIEDLELSVRTGIWATQSHNEEALNKAFQAVDNVYLVFSANKSGEYFGYAKMVSAINDDPAAAIEFAPQVQTTDDTDLPKAIPTESTEFAPKGRIIDDSARGTIFWEAEREDSDVESEGSVSPKEITVDGEGSSKAWGKPFKLEWLSTTKLPFYRTRGIRNPWNSNREVKIARDGTELEPSVGRRLIGLFNRVQSPVPHMPMGMPIIAGYPPQGHMRPQYAR